MIDADMLARVRKVRIETLAQSASKMQRASSIEWEGPCPACGGTDRFAVNTRKQVFNCRHCHAKGDVIALAQLIQGCNFTDAVHWLDGSGPELRHAPRAPEPSRRDDKLDSRRFALKIWAESVPLIGTIAAGYLVTRGLDPAIFPPFIFESLRFHPACPWERGRAPCMVALFRDVLTDEPCGIHRTRLSAAGERLDRKALGTAGAIKLWPDAEVTSGLCIAEGIETALAAALCVEHAGTLLEPMWACGFRVNIAKFPPLAGVESITIIVDNDENGAGQKDAQRCADTWLNAGREVIRLIPRELGSDFNDWTIGRRR